MVQPVPKNVQDKQSKSQMSGIYIYVCTEFNESRIYNDCSVSSHCLIILKLNTTFPVLWSNRKLEQFTVGHYSNYNLRHFNYFVTVCVGNLSQYVLTDRDRNMFPK